MRCGVLIPVYEPDEKLGTLARELSTAGLETVIVNDGSTTGQDVLDGLAAIHGVTLLGYAENRGKGHALKLGLSRMAEQGFDAAVTADADGQHTPRDIRRVMEALEREPGKLVLGMRDVSQMPPKSKTGNSMTRALFRALYGIDLRDTQTGLRGIPLNEASTKGLLALPGERYEYEMEMLIESPRLFPGGVTELPIETVYIDNNRASHFRPLQDGAKIYAVLFRKLPGFLLSSLLAFAIDYALFNLLYYAVFGGKLVSVASTVLARAVSGSCNYYVNRRFVFGNAKKKYTFLNYWKLALCILAANAAVMYLFVDVLGQPAFAMKLLVEAMLYLVSFTVQHKWARGAEK